MFLTMSYEGAHYLLKKETAAHCSYIQDTYYVLSFYECENYG